MTDEGIDLGIPGLGPAVRIGHGGFADVYRAEQTHLRRAVAVKVLRAPASDDDARRRFERECQAVGVVSGHPNIVGVHEGGFTTDGRAYLVMEYCTEGSLFDRLRRDGPMAPETVIEIGQKIGRALGVAHDAGVLHRDVKPANILVTAYGEPALADFGIARIEGGHQTATGVVTASIAHAAPEVLEGAHASACSDLYSLGSTMFELAVGRAPHVRPDDGSVWALINRVMSLPVPDPPSLGVPEPIASVIRRATARQPDDRYQSAADLVADLTPGPRPGRPTTPAVPSIPSSASTMSEPLTPGFGAASVQIGADSRQIPTTSLPPTDPAVSPVSPVPATSAPVTQHFPASEGFDAGSGMVTAAPVAQSRVRRRGRAVLLGVVVLLAAVLGGGAVWYQLSSDELPPVTLVFPEGETGPIEDDVSYDLALDGLADTPVTYQLVVDGEPAGPLAEQLPEFTPSDDGRHSLAVEVTRGEETVASNTIELYVIGEFPSAGFRVNLLAARAEPENWPATIREFDRLVADGHEGLLLLPSDWFATHLSGFWQLFIPGFGDDREQALKYCTDRGLAVPNECFVGTFDAEAGFVGQEP